MAFDHEATFERHLPHDVDAIRCHLVGPAAFRQRSDGSREKAIHQRLCHEFKLETKYACSLPLVRPLQGKRWPSVELRPFRAPASFIASCAGGARRRWGGRTPPGNTGCGVASRPRSAMQAVAQARALHRKPLAL